MNTTAVADGSAEALFASLNSKAGSATASKMTEAQSRFLTLLTTQLKNQDPLNPMDNAQMTSQLAQISTVDGIEKLNATLQKLLSASNDAQATQAASLVGHSVLVPGNGLQLIQGVAAGGIELAGAADEVTLTVRDPNGLTIRTLNLGALPAGASSFSWDGASDNGTPAVDGRYSVAIQAKRGKDAVTATALELDRVESVNRSNQGITLNTALGQIVTMADLRQIF